MGGWDGKIVQVCVAARMTQMWQGRQQDNSETGNEVGKNKQGDWWNQPSLFILCCDWLRIHMHESLM